MQKNLVLFFVCLSFTVMGCGDGLEKFPTASVTGRVLCEGQPVPFAQVYFEPLRQGESAIVGKPAFAIADDQGNFELGTYSSKDGAVVGKHRVRVDPPVPGKNPPGWKCNCEMDSNKDVMQVDVVDGDNQFDINLPKLRAGAAPTTGLDEDELEEMED